MSVVSEVVESIAVVGADVLAITGANWDKELIAKTIIYVKRGEEYDA